VGKAVAMQEKDGVIHAYGHETAGVPLAEDFLRRLTGEKALCRYVLNMVELHMKPNMYAAQNSGQKAWNRLFDRSACPEDLLLLAKADHRGRINAAPYAETERTIRARLSAYQEMMARPHITRADLLARGIQPGEEMGRLLEEAHRLRLAGVKKEDALQQMRL
jgi:tRNA nucleotidyltransferase (CCA-adding enzyme)